MIRDKYFPSDFETIDQDPTVPTTDKLAIIKASPVIVQSTSIIGNVYDDDFVASLPFVPGGSFHAGTLRRPNILLADRITLGDAQLYGNGIGSRILKAAIRHSLTLNPHTAELYGVWVRMGFVNTVTSVLGEENVAVFKGGTRYGWQGQKNLDAVLDDFPPDVSTGYQVHQLSAHIDPEIAQTWEVPEIGEPIISGSSVD